MTESVRQGERAGRGPAAEWATRVDLAALYRLVVLSRWDDMIFTHISARVPGEDSFLINPYGLFFEEMTASDLVVASGRADLGDKANVSDLPGEIVALGMQRVKKLLEGIIDKYAYCH